VATLNLLSRDSMKTFQELADEPFRDLLQRRRCGRARGRLPGQGRRHGSGPESASWGGCLKHRTTKKSCEETGMTSFGIRTPTDLLNKLIEEQRDFEKSNWLSARATPR